MSGFNKYRIKIQKHSGFSSRLAVKGNENYVVQVTNVYGKKADVKLHVK